MTTVLVFLKSSGPLLLLSLEIIRRSTEVADERFAAAEQNLGAFSIGEQKADATHVRKCRSESVSANLFALALLLYSSLTSAALFTYPSMKTFLRALAVSSLAAGALAFTNSATLLSLKATPLARASDEISVSLPSLWRADTPFGLADEVSVCTFLRHFG
jgi:hypothetical protein